MINSHDSFILVEEVDGRTFSISISISPTATPPVGWGSGQPVWAVSCRKSLLCHVVHWEQFLFLPSTGGCGSGTTRPHQPGQTILPRSLRPHLISSSSAPTLSQVDMLWMTNSKMSREGIVSTECFLLGTEVTANLLLSCIMNSIFVACEIVRSREDGVAGFAGGRVRAFAFMGPVLSVPKRR